MKKGKKIQQKTSEQIEVIKQDAKVKIECSFSYYTALFALADFMITDKTKEQIDHFYYLLKENKELTEPWHFHYRTILSIMTEFQKQAKETKQTKFITKEEYQAMMNLPE